MISRTTIEKLDPCQSRLDNYIKHYGDRKFTPKQFMGRKNVSQGDKIWVAIRLMPRVNLGLAAVDIAKSVLHICENSRPMDKRPRKAIEAPLLYTTGEITLQELKTAANAAHCAAQDADQDYDYDAASAAYIAAHAAHTYVAPTDQAAYASSYATASVAGKITQEKLVRKILLKHWKEGDK